MRPIARLLSNANVDPIIDRKIRKAIAGYSPLTSKPIAQETKALLEQVHLYLGRHLVEHDDAVTEGQAIAAECNRRALAGLFLASLSTGWCELRGGLPSYAILTQMPPHSFQATPADNCGVCGCFRTDTSDLTFFNSTRVAIGSLVRTDVYSLWFNISIAHKSASREPNDADLKIFRQILQSIREVPADTKPLGLTSKIRATLPYRSTNEQARALLDILGALSVLETSEHQGFLHKYTNLALAPRTSHSSDWAYPVGWWRGADGVNDDAVNYWFGDWIK